MYGTSWRIGDGANVSVRPDSWLTDVINLRPMSDIPEGMEELRVQHLLLNDDSSWNVALTHSMFNERDRALIHRTLISLFSSKDQLFWAAERSGHYSIKSAYYFLAQEASTDIPSCLSNSNWERVWKLFLPSRIKYILWKCAVRILPTKDRLLSRHVALNDELCELYRCETETIVQAIVGCDRARDVWELYLAQGLPVFIANMDQWWS